VGRVDTTFAVLTGGPIIDSRSQLAAGLVEGGMSDSNCPEKPFGLGGRTYFQQMKFGLEEADIVSNHNAGSGVYTK